MSAVEAALARIAELEPELSAWATLADPAAVRAAAAAARGPLAGLLVGVKDILDTAGLPTGYGSPRWAGHRPGTDATAVRLLTGAGAVVVGKTVTTEFALFDPPPTRNPHDPARTPGGSSSGSAAAVAAGMVPLALGTQTVGSVIRPASFCGVWGFVPSHGVIDRGGLRILSPMFDRIGLLAASAELITAALPVLAARPLAGPSAARPPRLALVHAAEWPAAEPGTRELVQAAADTLGAETITLPATFAGLADAHRTVLGPHVARSLADEVPAGGPSVTTMVQEGRAVAAVDHLAAIDLIERCRPALAGVAGPYDALLAPAATGEAPGRESTGDPVMSRAWTALGVPLLTVPGLRGPSGLPVGLQLIGHPGRDLDLVAVGANVAERLSSR